MPWTFRPSKMQDQSSEVVQQGWWPGSKEGSLRAFPQIQRGFLDPLFSSLAYFLREKQVDGIIRSECLLFSIKYGIPKISAMEKSAIRIMGLFRKARILTAIET